MPGPADRSLARSVGLPSNLLGKPEGEIIQWPQAAVLAAVAGREIFPKATLQPSFPSRTEGAVFTYPLGNMEEPQAGKSNCEPSVSVI